MFYDSGGGANGLGGGDDAAQRTLRDKNG